MCETKKNPVTWDSLNDVIVRSRLVVGSKHHAVYMNYLRCNILMDY